MKTAPIAKTRRHYRLPFGAEIIDDGHIRFRLWAPAAERVELCLTSSDQRDNTRQTILPMAPEPEGWFSLTTSLAGAGSRYRYRINGDMQVPDPASRFQPQDIHGPSEVIDANAWAWQDTAWKGRSWEEAIIYELHIGSFTPQGSFKAAQEKLDYLADLGITAIELMPVADFPGRRNWGYDGAYLFAPDSQYGTPGELKALVDAAHARGLMVFLDVVYNHFGPEGNYLHVYAPQFFTPRHLTPWGLAINFDGSDNYRVRQFYIHNALYWLEEYHFDGLRFDAVHTIIDESQPDILTELAQQVYEYFGNTRQVHLILENDHNAAHYLQRNAAGRPQWYVAQWNDDLHHALHVLLTDETSGYYMDYTNRPIQHLGRCLTQGFAYQGEPSAYRDDQPRGEPSDYLPPTAFVSFLQNHDQVGNRAFGERLVSLTAPGQLRAALALILLAPSPPLLFMGEEWGSRRPFPFFCDFNPDLAAKVVAGRRREFARFPQFSDPDILEHLPDPTDKLTFDTAVLDWHVCSRPQHRSWLDLYRELLAVRHCELIPRLINRAARQGDYSQLDERALGARWILGDGSELLLFANLGDASVAGVACNRNQLLYATHVVTGEQADTGYLPPWSVFWYLNSKGSGT